jgi:hypothetical protein
VESASRQAVSEELEALGNLPSEAELSALIERYAGSKRVSCEQADLFFASVGVGEVAPAKSARRSAAPRTAAEVARGSWLDKLGPRSSAPPRGAAASSLPPALSMAAAVALPPEEPITIEHGLEHLPATTYSSAPPPSALPTEDSAPVALPLSSHPAPQLAAADSVVVERWGMAETTPEPAPQVELEAASAAEDALLERWSDDLDRALGQPVASERPASLSAAPAAALEFERAAATDAPERWSAPPPVLRPREMGRPRARSGAALLERGAAIPSSTDVALDAGSDAIIDPSHAGGGLVAESRPAPQIVQDEDAPLSAAELSLLEQWSAEDPAEPAPAARSQPAQPAASTADNPDDADAELDVELEEEIELEPDDLIEIDSE